MVDTVPSLALSPSHTTLIKQEIDKSLPTIPQSTIPLPTTKVSKLSKLLFGLSDSDEKPDLKHKCDQCPRAFATQTGLRVHTNKHLRGERRERECRNCAAKFMFENHLMAHRGKVHGHKLFKCPTCCQKFTSVERVRAHELKEHPTDGQLYTCTHCSKQ
eukprot:365411_1